jgi:hypothetical protein
MAHWACTKDERPTKATKKNVFKFMFSFLKDWFKTLFSPKIQC